MLVDWLVFRRLQSGRTVECGGEVETPGWVRGRGRRKRKRGGWEWVVAWVGREVLAGGIWAVAVWGGTGVVWRGRRFWVGVDMMVHEVGGKGEVGVKRVNGYEVVSGKERKARRD